VKPKFNDAFWRWFGDSVVCNEDGSPKVVYHGTQTKEIREFRMDKKLSDYGDTDLGFFFSGAKQCADEFGTMSVAAYLSMKNPVHIDALEFFNIINDHPAWYARDFRRLRRQYIKAGHDGIIVSANVNINRLSGPGWGQFDCETYIVFRPEQIKSVYNDGTWDADDPSIRSNPPVHAIRSIERRHAVTDPDHVFALAKSIRAHGWQGPPLVIWGPINWGNSVMLTGVHRMAALDLLLKQDREFAEGLDIPVLVVDQQGLSEEVIDDAGIHWDGDIVSLYDSDEIATLLDAMGEREAASLVRDEGGDVWDADDPRIGSNPPIDSVLGIGYLIKGKKIIKFLPKTEHHTYIRERPDLFGLEQSSWLQEASADDLFKLLFDKGWVRIRYGGGTLNAQGEKKSDVRQAVSSFVVSNGMPSRATVEWLGIFRALENSEEITDFINDGSIPSRNPPEIDGAEYGYAGIREGFKITGPYGETAIGYAYNADFPNDIGSPSRGELFLVNVPEEVRRKGAGKAISIEALKLMTSHGAETVVMHATSVGGQRIIDSLIMDGYISEPIRASSTGKKEYRIHNDGVWDADEHGLHTGARP